jgi:hypothetical protein
MVLLRILSIGADGLLWQEPPPAFETGRGRWVTRAGFDEPLGAPFSLNQMSGYGP